jgi:hypothetical protein
VVAHICNPSDLRSEGRRNVVQGWPGKKQETLSEKQTKKPRRIGRVVAEVVDPLLSKLEALSSISSTTKKKREEKR